jgi:hypothetical protein
MPLSRPEYWRGRAEEARALAESMGTHDGIEAMRKVAFLYDELAYYVKRFGKEYPDVKWTDNEPSES